MSDKAAKCTHLLHPFCTTCKASQWAWNRALTSQVLRGGGDPAPLEEGVCFGVHHQQPGFVPASFNGSNDIWMGLTLHRHTVHLKKTRGKKNRETLGEWHEWYLNFANPTANPSKHDQKKRPHCCFSWLSIFIPTQKWTNFITVRNFFFPWILSVCLPKAPGQEILCVHTQLHTHRLLTKNPETFHYLSYICLYTFINSVSYVTVTVAL